MMDAMAKSFLGTSERAVCYCGATRAVLLSMKVGRRDSLRHLTLPVARAFILQNAIDGFIRRGRLLQSPPKFAPLQQPPRLSQQSKMRCSILAGGQKHENYLNRRVGGRIKDSRPR